MEDDASIPISALQHFLFCPRQCALIHVERLWAENVYTAEGRLLHERSDQPRSERRRGVRTATALSLVSDRCGIHGVADVVEFHTGQAGSLPYPVEYKRGRPKAHRADEVQLCAQAFCLEEMLKVSIAEGALFYGKLKRRQVVIFDTTLRELTEATITAVRRMLSERSTPRADYVAARCDACSLLELCRPRLLAPGRHVATWLARQLEKE